MAEVFIGFNNRKNPKLEVSELDPLTIKKALESISLRDLGLTQDSFHAFGTLDGKNLGVLASAQSLEELDKTMTRAYPGQCYYVINPYRKEFIPAFKQPSSRPYEEFL